MFKRYGEGDNIIIKQFPSSFERVYNPPAAFKLGQIIPVGKKGPVAKNPLQLVEESIDKLSPDWTCRRRSCLDIPALRKDSAPKPLKESHPLC